MLGNVVSSTKRIGAIILYNYYVYLCVYFLENGTADRNKHKQVPVAPVLTLSCTVVAVSITVHDRVLLKQQQYTTRNTPHT
jgi:hypothetical protein